jgi:hypothetical protein
MKSTHSSPRRLLQRSAHGLAGTLVLAALATAAGPLAGQHPFEGMEWSVSMVREGGAPVAPVFEGWYRNENGTFSLVFGYHNLNTQEAVSIPLGTDNFIEPAQYDGMQPTYFYPIPSNGSRRQFGAFTVVVPADFGDREVVWNLTHRGHTWKIPGHVRNPHYILDAVHAPARGTWAATMKFDPTGPGVKGRDGIVTGPISARVGAPVPLSVWVDPAPRPRNIVWWFKHQGPGDVTFGQQESTVEGGAGDVEVRTTARFDAPGSYLLRVMAVENIGTIEFHCCWTNGYVRVTVTE